MLYIGALIVTPFPHYIPPDFERGFLRNKEAFFYSTLYGFGFFAHITSAPLALLVGTVQLSRTIRMQWPAFHRRLGQFYVGLVLLCLAPGGFLMALRAYGQLSGQICFAVLSVAIWASTAMAWREALVRRFASHERWMLRSYTLMCSAILLRLISFCLSHFQLSHLFRYQLAAWLSWVPAILFLEAIFLFKRSRAA